MGHGEKVARIFFTGAGLALALFAMLHGSGALAQTAAQTSTPPPVLANDGGYEPGTLTAFARAARGVSSLRDSYMPRITAANIAERPERAEALFDEMRARMHDTIEAAGLTVEGYEAISARAAQDAQLRARIEAILTGKSAPPAAGAPGQGVRAPVAPPPAGNSRIAAAQRAMDATAAGRRVAELERKLAEAETRARNAEAARRAAEARADRLQADHAALTRDFNAELNARPSTDDVAAMSQALAQAGTERARLARDLSRLNGELAGTITALADLDAALAVRAARADTRAVRRFTRLEPAPALLPVGAGVTRVGAAAGTLQARLDAAEARNMALRATYDAERSALRHELARIGDAIADAQRGLEAIGTGYGEPVETAEEIEAPAYALPEAREVLEPPEPAMTDAEPEPAPAPAAELAPEPVRESGESETTATMPRPEIADGIQAYDAGDYELAYAIWRDLAEAGAPLAQFHIGALYFEGRGVPRDLDAARIWLSRALEQGVERARFLLGRVEKGLATTG